MREGRLAPSFKPDLNHSAAVSLSKSQNISSPDGHTIDMSQACDSVEPDDIEKSLPRAPQPCTTRV